MWIKQPAKRWEVALLFSVLLVLLAAIRFEAVGIMCRIERNTDAIRETLQSLQVHQNQRVEVHEGRDALVRDVLKKRGDVD